MWTFEQVWATVDQKIDKTTEYVWETYESIHKWATEFVDNTKRGFFTKVDIIKTSINDKYNWIVKSATETWNEIVEAAKSTIDSVSKRVDSIQDAVNNWIAEIRKEWWQLIVKIKDETGKTIDMAMERVQNWVSETLAYVDWKWQYVVDEASDYKNSVTAISKVAYNHTVKWWVEKIKEIGTEAMVALQNLKNEYKQELAASESNKKKPLENIGNSKVVDSTWIWNNSTEKTETNSTNEVTIKKWDTLYDLAVKQVWKENAQNYINKLIAANTWLTAKNLKIWTTIKLPPLEWMV